MKMLVEPQILQEFVGRASFKSNGDSHEQHFGHYLSERFPNCERFWQVFVVPLTRRMDGYPTELSSDIPGFRESLKPEVEEIASAHYTMFDHLAHAHLHLQGQLDFFLEDMYVRLGSACDLVEIVLENWYLLLLKCQGRQSHTLEQLTRDEFLKIAGEWYDNNYSRLFTYYLSKGKSPPLNLPARKNILEEYLGDSISRKRYARHAQLIREFRNVIVHDVKIGRIIDIDGRAYVPRTKEIQRYRSWRQVAAAASNSDIILQDFAVARCQAQQDLDVLESLVNDLWDRMISEFREEFFSLKRSRLREMFAIEFSSAGLTARPPETSSSTHAPVPGSYFGGSADHFRQSQQERRDTD